MYGRFTSTSPQNLNLICKTASIMQSEILSEVSAYVVYLLKDKLPITLTFHNLDHTLDVVNGVREIGVRTELSAEDQETVEIAAWLHDTGYLHLYKGHEEESIRIAKIFLSKFSFPQARIQQIIGCIEATKYPQTPQNLLEQVLCDADFMHLTFSDYRLIADKLRVEWSCYLNKSYSDMDWNEENCSMLSEHTYFTHYGRTILQELKDLNLEKLKIFPCD